MTKLEFLDALDLQISSLPKNERDERLVFWSELIDDKIEDGLSEEEAVAQIGSVDEVALQILSDAAPEEPKGTKKELKGSQIALIAVGSPLWVPLLISAAAVALSLYISLWAVIISFWAADLSLAVAAPTSIALFFVYLFSGNLGAAISMLGAGAICGGLSILAFEGCKRLTLLTVKLTKKIFKKFSSRREEASE